MRSAFCCARRRVSVLRTRRPAVNWRPAQFCLRTLAAAVGCVLVLQVFLSSFGAALAFGRASIGELFVICHGDGGSAPVNGDPERKLPCSLCTLAIGGAPPAGPI